ncbi:unnamed protein product [Rotaria sp. Silwood2]|nr:unnamed protein product [Rotaria sp. Silwood2]CAF2975327.1 unnamed protein product [Rotaria sp. Silwood2]CAF3325594.1 unnamed protein product [Rotaria sp. Silwood2]CAF4069574.1 unnamed protein product [Rotaria sp. Silwood2]CAF4149755.1 unnamed protein product [Rotaria sp. Silwood2]
MVFESRDIKELKIVHKDQSQSVASSHDIFTPSSSLEQKQSLIVDHPPTVSAVIGTSDKASSISSQIIGNPHDLHITHQQSNTSLNESILSRD